MSAYVSETTAGVIIKVKVQTRASRDEVVGPHGDSLKVRITVSSSGGGGEQAFAQISRKTTQDSSESFVSKIGWYIPGQKHCN